MSGTYSVDEVLRATGYRERLEHIRRVPDVERGEVSEELCRRAHAALRQDPGESLQCARLGVRVAMATGEPRAMIPCLRVAAQAALQSARYGVSLRMLDRATAAAQGATDLETADLEALRIQALTHLERYEEARRLAERALTVFQEAGDRKGEIRTLISLAELEFRLDRPRAALAHYSHLDRILPPETSARLRGVVAGNRANSLEAVNRFRAATRQFEFATEVFKAEGCDHTAAQVEYNAAYADMLRGRYEDALRKYARVEVEFERLGDERHLGHTELDRAEIHLALNLPEDARKLAGLSERRFAKLGLGKERAQAAHLAGRASELLGEPELAESEYRRAAEGFAALGLTERRIRCLVRRAGLARATGRREDARELLDEAETLRRKEMNPLGGVAIHLLRARILIDELDPEGALDLVRDARARCRRIHAPWVDMEIFHLEAQAHSLAGRFPEAIGAYRTAIEILEQYRGGVPADEYMAAFLAGRSELYEEIVDLLVTSGEIEDAFEFAERAKSRALVDLLSNDRGMSGSGTPLTSSRLAHLREKLNAIYRRQFVDGGEVDERSLRAAIRAQQEAKTAEDDLARLLREARIRDPEGTSLLAVDAPDLASIRENLEPGTVFIQYFVTTRQLFIFVLTREGLQVVKKDVGSADLRLLLVRFHFHLSRFSHSKVRREEEVLAATRANLEQLAAHLIDPIVTDLHAKRLVIAPHGVLHHVPFHALPLSDGWVSDRFEVVCTPSAAVYEFCDRGEDRARGDASVFALPDRFAPRIQEEARLVGEILGTERVFIGAEATLAALKREASHARVLHIATHGMFRHSQPMLSAIRLADGWMNLYDLYDLRVRGEIVVLSTCESGTADVTNGDEILGLTRGFLFAGAPALLTSQWRVNDAVTSEFMECFHLHLRESGDPADAHRQAMADVRSRHPHPYYWAPFFLTGRPLGKRSGMGVGTQGEASASAEPRALAMSGRSEG